MSVAVIHHYTQKTSHHTPTPLSPRTPHSRQPLCMFSRNFRFSLRGRSGGSCFPSPLNAMEGIAIEARKIRTPSLAWVDLRQKPKSISVTRFDMRHAEDSYSLIWLRDLS